MLKYVLYQQALAIYWMEHGENQHDGSVDISLPVHQRIYTRVNIWIAMRIHSSFGFELLKYVLVFYNSTHFQWCFTKNKIALFSDLMAEPLCTTTDYM